MPQCVPTPSVRPLFLDELGYLRVVVDSDPREVGADPVAEPLTVRRLQTQALADARPREVVTREGQVRCSSASPCDDDYVNGYVNRSGNGGNHRRNWRAETAAVTIIRARTRRWCRFSLMPTRAILEARFDFQIVKHA